MTLSPLLAIAACCIAGLLSACQPAAAPASDSKGGAVLVLSPHGIPVVEQAMAEIARRNAAARDGAPLIIDFRQVASRSETTAAVQSLLPTIARYKVIFTPSHTFARAAQLLVADRPIVFDGVDDPVANCLVDSLRHPGRNATGYAHLLPDTELKMLELLHDGFPALRHAVVLVSGGNVAPQSCDPADPFWRGELPPCERGLHEPDAALARLIDADGIAAFGRQRGVAVRFLVMCEAADFELLRSAAGKLDDAGIIVPWHSLFDDHVQALVALVAALRRPAIYPNERFTEAGGMLALEPLLDLGKDRATVLTLMQVIDGRAPATLPVLTPRGFEVVFNAKAATQQGLRPSPFLLRRADRILAP